MNPHFHKQAVLVALLSSICWFCMSATGFAQTQLGADIDGEAVGDYSGGSVSLSSYGSRVAIAAPSNDGSAPDAGHVRVYQWSGAAWEQIGADIDGEAAGDGGGNGNSVSLSSDGDRLAIGADKNDGNGIVSGHVRVYQWTDSVWEQLGVDIDGEAAGDRSGGTVSLSADGNRLAIGAERNDDNGSDSGHVRVYQWSGSVWEQLGFDIDGEAADDESSDSISLSPDGNRLAIGARFNDGNGAFSGHVRVYQWSGTDWTQLGADMDGEVASDQSGSAVALSSDGNRLAIGAKAADGANAVYSGHVRVYRWSGTVWQQIGEDISGAASEGGFGWNLSLSSDGNRLAARNAGHVNIYQWSGTDWTQLGSNIYGEDDYDEFGVSISLSPNGNRLAVGAPSNDGNGERSGHVRVYDLSMFNPFKINPGLNDAWYDDQTDGQGFFITVFPDLGYVSLAWFTYDTELPPIDAIANLGDAGHRWLTAIGPITDNKVMMNITMTSGGIFDTATEIERTDPPGSDGTLVLTFDDCNSGTIDYDITSINQQGTVPIRRVADDNIVICEALRTD